jgi:hypothetical protein
MDKAVELPRQPGCSPHRPGNGQHAPVRVPYYGSEMPLNRWQRAFTESQLLTVQPYDPALCHIEKTIRSAGLGLNPQNDGKLTAFPCHRSAKAPQDGNTCRNFWKTTAPPSAMCVATAMKPSRP